VAQIVQPLDGSSSKAEESVHKPHLSRRAGFEHEALPLADHAHDLEAFDCSGRRRNRLESLRRLDHPLQRAVIRLQPVVEVFDNVVAVDLNTGRIPYVSTGTRGGGVNAPATEGKSVYFTTGNSRCDSLGCQSPEPNPNHGLSMMSCLAREAVSQNGRSCIASLLRV
jgi:hypothetical protein